LLKKPGRHDMSKRKILVIEDDENIQELVKYNLEKDGFAVLTSLVGEEGLDIASKEQPDLILLDLMLPGIDGLDVCRILKSDSRTEQIAIVMMTAKGEESDIVVGLELGADDYVTKPFSPKVLLARIKAVLRRKSGKPSSRFQMDSDEIKINNIHIHMGRREVKIDNRKVELTSTEFKLLHLLASHPGWVFTRNQINDMVRGEDIIITERAVDVHIVGLRKKLGDCGDYIESVRGVGYRFRD
jgi:two-component system phosphate regulon response regulator PhoB